MNIIEIEQLIGYTFKNKKILERALTHSSATPKKTNENYEKLEFFGDAFLNFVIAKYLFQTKPKLSVGEMTKLRAQIVCTENLKNATKRLGIWEHIQMAESVAHSSGDKKLYADVFESIVGGIYADGGSEASEKFVFYALGKEIKTTSKQEKLIDYKTALQEYVQGEKLGEIIYETAGFAGEVHTPIFEMVLYVGEKEISRGSGESKKKASQACAKQALVHYGVIKKEKANDGGRKR